MHLTFYLWNIENSLSHMKYAPIFSPMRYRKFFHIWNVYMYFHLWNTENSLFIYEIHTYSFLWNVKKCFHLWVKVDHRVNPGPAEGSLGMQNSQGPSGPICLVGFFFFSFNSVLGQLLWNVRPKTRKGFRIFTRF